ncbi:MAG: putative toxin-antitoxin system toxin component, PIN family [Opitutaceae bacterium]|jgi:putative PIN family toxin of toxin-antitoxin system
MSAIVLDTSVLIAGLLSRRGAASALVDALFDDRLKLACSAPVFAEYMDVMARPEFAETITNSERMAVMLKLRASGRLLTPQAVPDDNWPDADDLPFVALALATEAKVIVTLNPDDFSPALRHGLRILSPSQAKREFL